MQRSRVVRAHLVASVLATLTVASFLTATVTVELAGDDDAIRAVKQYVLYGLAVLVPAMAIAGITGQRLGGRSQAPVIMRKRRRMKVVGGIGMSVLVPCAIVLHLLADSGDFGTAFAAVQALEIAGGCTNLSLLALNLRDGRRLSARRRAAQRSAARSSAAIRAAR